MYSSLSSTNVMGWCQKCTARIWCAMLRGSYETWSHLHLRLWVQAICTEFKLSSLKLKSNLIINPQLPALLWEAERHRSRHRWSKKSVIESLLGGKIITVEMINCIIIKSLTLNRIYRKEITVLTVVAIEFISIFIMCDPMGIWFTGPFKN